MNNSARQRLTSALFYALRATFRAMPLAAGTRDRWRQKFLGRFPKLRPAPGRQNAMHCVTERRPRVHAGGPALGHASFRQEPLPHPMPATLVAFYLPQFHPIPENDVWWGKGFTEWHNVARTLPQFEGHAQPRLPADLGFYDLRNPQVMRDQAALAAAYGIGAFCFYFYWFGGKTLLETPLRQWLDDTSIELPFCLCWANENWSRRWDGRDREVLVTQSHSPEDDIAFIAHVAAYLRDARYLRVDGKPLLLVYRPGVLPDAAETAQRWRTWCRDHGIGEIFLAYVQSFERPDPRSIGFDAAVEFPPNLCTPKNLTARHALLNPDFSGEILDWREVVEAYSRRDLPAYRLFPGVNCGWDNSPRRPGQGRIFLHSAPHRYGRWLHDTIHTRLAKLPAGERLVFINAWNEWAEGAMLEPDTALGHAWLEATRAALRPMPRGQQATHACAVVHAWYPEIFEEIARALRASGVDFRLIVTTTADKARSIREIALKYRFDAELQVGPNRGRDILPFLRALYRLRSDGEQYVLKLHTKRSPHLLDGQRWRQELVDRLVSHKRARRILFALRDDPTIGLVAPDGYLVSIGERPGANLDGLHYLAARTGLTNVRASTTFPAGSMFWARMDAFEPLLDAHLYEWEFEEECGQIDGTLAHAVERIFAECARASGLRVVTSAAVSGESDGHGRHCDTGPGR